MTTKERINAALPAPWSLSQENGRWYLYHRRDYPEPWERVCLFQDGATVWPDGRYEGGLPLAAEVELREVRRRVGRYVERYMRALVAGKIPPPSAGDCWLCSMRVAEDGRPLSEVSGDQREHFEGHMEEGYLVPSMVENAIRASSSTSEAARWWLSAVWIRQIPEHSQHGKAEKVIRCWGRIAEKQVKRALRKYMLRPWGIVGR